MKNKNCTRIAVKGPLYMAICSLIMVSYLQNEKEIEISVHFQEEMEKEVSKGFGYIFSLIGFDCVKVDVFCHMIFLQVNQHLISELRKWNFRKERFQTLIFFCYFVFIYLPVFIFCKHFSSCLYLSFCLNTPFAKLGQSSV